jgi:hypothetical protein
MGIFDWLRPDSPAPPDSGLSRRAFFARVAGAGAASTDGTGREASGGPRPGEHTFHVAGFPYHDGPVLVPILRAGLEFALVREPTHPTDPESVRIQWGRDMLGYVPAPLNAEVSARLRAGVTLRCEAVEVSPAAELTRVLRVRVSVPEPPVAGATS